MNLPNTVITNSTPAIMPASRKPWKKIIIMMVIGITLLVESAWAVWTFTDLPSRFNKNAQLPIVEQSFPKESLPKASITLQTSKDIVKVGEVFTIVVSEESNKPTDGTDLIINYDPKVLTIIPSNKKVVAVGNLYDDYPQNTVDENAGKIALSGITSKAEGSIANGILGVITFKAQAMGQTEIKVDFKKGSSIDSNISELNTAKDLLEVVSNAKIMIQ